MYLWKIRQNPHDGQISCDRRGPHRFIYSPLFSWAVLLLALSAGWVATAQDSPTAQTSKSESGESDASGVAGNPNEATELLRTVRQQLANRRSIRAQLTQQIQLQDQKLALAGSYAGAGLKLRLELHVELAGGSRGALTEICDGDVLWTDMELADKRTVTRRDVKQILNAVASAKQTPESVLNAELGLGGIVALLASLERTMDFTSVRDDSWNGMPVRILQGRWKPDFEKKLPQGKDQSLLDHIPDSVRIYVDPTRNFPVRFVYLKSKKMPGMKPSLRALMSLEFRDVELDAEIPDQQFNFIPPDNVLPEDITRQYIERIKAPAKPNGEG